MVKSTATTIVASAQERKPWAKSRKTTSGVRIPTHFLRSRPAKYLPIPEDTHCVIISQMPAATPNGATDCLERYQAEIVARLIPGPNVISTMDTPTAPKAPAAIAPHSTAELELSTDASVTCIA